MKSQFIIFCGPKMYFNKVNTVTGGIRRFQELVTGLKKNGYFSTTCSSTYEVISCVLKRWKTENNDEVKYCIAFDERFLLSSISSKIFGYQIIFCPRGNKLEHFKYDYSYLRLTLYRVIFSLLYRVCDVMIFQTKKQGLEFKKLFKIGGSIFTLPNNVDASWMKELQRPFQWPKELASLKVGFLGGDSKRKGFPLLVRTIEHANKQKAPIKFVMGGNFVHPPIFENVINVGYVHDLKKFFSSIDILAVPSEYDSFPNVFLESLAAGVPVIMSKNEISSEICGQNSSILFPPTYQEFYAKLLMITMCVDFMNTIVMDCIALREKYSFCWVSEFEKVAFGQIGN